MDGINLVAWHSDKDMGMPCDKKKKYMTSGTAQLVLDGIRDRAKKEHWKPRQKSIYKCSVCGFWHLTKQEVR